MPRIMNRISLSGAYCTDLHAGSDSNGCRGYRLRQKNATVPFDRTSSGECQIVAQKPRPATTRPSLPTVGAAVITLAVQ